MFERPHHQRIEVLLKSIDEQQLLRQSCLFGGGTAIALRRGEYRESVDVDFLCSSIDGYRALRQQVDHSQGTMDWLFRQPLPLARSPRVDQYGIRCAVDVGGLPIKLEIVFEARLVFDDPLPQDRVCGVWALTDVDLVASKLMANTDRWADDSVMSRDLIDLAMLTDDASIIQTGLTKAQRAYGTSIDKAFTKAKAQLLERDKRLATCMRNLGMTMSEADLRHRIQSLKLSRSRSQTTGRAR